MMLSNRTQDDVASLPGSVPDQPIEAESPIQNDEGYEASDTSSVLSSLAAEIRQGVLENGRMYANFGKHEYILPIDETELDRLDLNHAKYFITQGDRHFIAPIGKDPQRVLDLGTGTGIWAIDFADQYPSASVTGTDIAPVQPQWVPPNLQFQIDDVESDWTFEKGTFDYIHMRDLYHGIRDFPKLVCQAYNTLAPGGWFELSSIHPEPVANDGSLDPGSHYMELVNTWEELGRRIGVNPDSAKMFRGWIEEQGFTEVREWQFRVPCSPWPKDPRLKKIGQYELLNVVEGASGFLMRGWTKEFGMTREQLAMTIMGIRKELMTNKIHAWIPFIVVIGRKPLSTGDESESTSLDT